MMRSLSHPPPDLLSVNNPEKKPKTGNSAYLVFLKKRKETRNLNLRTGPTGELKKKKKGPDMKADSMYLFDLK